jgi:adenine/guanine/hypoxanthine permease
MMIDSKKTEILSGVGMFFAIWTLTFLYSGLMQSIGFSNHYWFSTTATFIALGCIISACVIKKPYIIGPGLGVGWFAVSQILPQSHLLNFYLCIVISGAILIGISQLRSVKHANQLLPNYLQATMSIGIGVLFMRLALEHEMTRMHHTPSVFLFLASISLLLIFKLKGNRWGALITVGLVMMIGFLLGQTHWQGVFAKPEPFKSLLQFSHLQIDYPILFRQVLGMTLFSFFDGATGVFCLRQIQMALHIQSSENKLSKAYLAIGIQNLFAGFFICGPNTLFIESAFGMELGGRKPFSLIVAGVCFMIFAFCFPLGQMIPQELFEGILFFIGLTLIAPIAQLKNQTTVENLISIFLIGIIMITKSILNGLLIGLILNYGLLSLYRKNMTRMTHIMSILALATLCMNCFA